MKLRQSFYIINNFIQSILKKKLSKGGNICSAGIETYSIISSAGNQVYDIIRSADSEENGIICFAGSQINSVNSSSDI